MRADGQRQTVQLEEVELDIEVDGATVARAGADGSGGDDGAESGARRRGRGRALVAGGVAAAVILALVVGQGVLDRQERERRARVAETPGLLYPLGPELRELWRTEATEMLVGTGPIAGVAVSVQDDAFSVRSDDGPAVAVPELVGRDPGTGVVLWRQQLPGETEPGAQSWLGCADALDDRHVLCSRSHVHQDGDIWESVTDSTAVVDSRDGTVVRQLDGDTATSWTPAPGGLLRADEASDGTGPTVTLADLVTGATLWRRELPARSSGRDSDDSDYVTAFATGDSLLVGTPDELWVLDAAGTVTHHETFDDDGWAMPVGSGAILRMSSGDQPGPGALLLPGGATVETDSYPATIAFDDGSVPDVALLSAADGISGLEARDLRDGRVLWTGRSQNVPLVLDGTVIDASGTVTARDARTGDALWTVPDTSATSLATDGDQVLAISSEAVIALDLADGHELWRTALKDIDRPEGDVVQIGSYYGATSWGGRLVLGGPSGETVLVGSD
ncbi:outer membrane protein assembly factor BamB family protein [Cellulomonas composti]|uniref:Pyrrolo-quinoline quinone repeat domain-containing protein n=1 Tax=Cellulomonas composti TaxID=266130 RepID=A0A511JD60_9CELL|nr:PQQ-binding-like beta-propeller repeat protein [Cellulomonas composti]GEL95886.1 hypothetical protein CCO02nite_25440 [Cellulomonas composti]